MRRRADLRSAVGARHQDRAVHLLPRAKTPITLAELDEANLGNALVDLIQPTGRHWGWQAVARRRRVGLEVGRDKVGRLLAMAGAIIRWRTAQAKNDDGQSRN